MEQENPHLEHLDLQFLWTEARFTEDLYRKIPPVLVTPTWAFLLVTQLQRLRAQLPGRPIYQGPAEDLLDEIDDGVTARPELPDDLEVHGGRRLLGSSRGSRDVDEFDGFAVQALSLADNVSLGQDLFGYGGKVMMINEEL